MATPVFCCGFECGVSGTAGQHWSLGASASFSTATVRSGARSLRINPSAATTGIATSLTLTGAAIFVIRAYIRFATLPNVNCTLITAQGNRGLVFNSSDNSVRLGRDTTNMAASGIVVTTGQWYRVDLKINVTNNPWVFDGKIDGTDLTQYTAALSAGTSSDIRIGTTSNSSSDFFVDDLIVCTDGADYPLGAGKVEHFIPTADGTHNIAGAADFQRTLTGTDILNATTTAFQLVDDVPLESSPTDFINMIAPPNAADYVECVFGPASGISTPTVGPRAVEVIAAIHQAGTGAGNMEIRMNDNGTTNAMYTASAVAGVTSLAYKRKHYGSNIANGGAWTVVSGAGNFNNLRMRFGSPGAGVDANPDQYLDCIMIEAEFVTTVNTNVATGVGQLTATGFAPTVTATQNTQASIGVGQLTASGFAPQTNQQINTALGQLTASGFAPSVIIGTVVNTALGTANVNGFQPTVSVTNHQTVSAGVGQVLITGLEPSVVLTLNPGAGQLLATGLAPAVTASNNQTVNAGVGGLLAIGFAPAIIINTVVYTATGQAIINGLASQVNQQINSNIGLLIATGFEPTVTASNHITVLTFAGQVVADGFNPQANSTINIAPGVVAVNGLDPTITITDNKIIVTNVGNLLTAGFTPQVNIQINTTSGQLLTNGFEPTVSITNNVIVQTNTGQVLVNGFETSIGGNIVVSSGVGQIDISGFAPTVSTTGHVITNTGKADLISTGFEPIVTVSDNISITTQVGTLAANGFAPSVEISVVALIGVGLSVINGLAPTVTPSNHVTIATQTTQGVLSGFSPDVVVGGSNNIIVSCGTGLLIINGFRPAVKRSKKKLILRSGITTGLILDSTVHNATEMLSSIKDDLNLNSNINTQL